MAEPQYRLQTEDGLSKQYSLARLIEKHSAGVVDLSAQCTADDGSTWTILADLIQKRSPKSAEGRGQSDSESASITQSETAVGESAQSRDQSLSKRESRRLRRLAANGGQRQQLASRSRAEASSPKPSPSKTQQDGSGEIRKPEDLIGVRLANDRYTITGKLGNGSMAYVLRASDSRLMTDVVVKVPKPEKMADAEIRDRFQRESQLLVQLTHPHVVKVLDVGEYQQLPYVVMQLLSGGTLTDRINAPSNGGKGMPPESLQTWLREVARALDFCYRKGMVHRDVKPANILFDEDENAYVSDFGLTKIMYGDFDNINPSDTASGIVLGTPNYISPEVVLGRRYDGRADQYSLGITVYHTLFGKAPMQGDNATATMINQTQKRLQLLSEIRSDVSTELALAVRKSIEKKPEARFDTCEEFADAVLEGLRAPVGKKSTVVPASDWSSSDSLQPPDSLRAKQRRRSSNSSARSRSGRPAPDGVESSANAALSDVEEALNWLDTEPVRDEGLPPRKGRAAPKKSTRGRSKSTAGGTVILGQEVHPGLVITLAIGVVALVLSVIIRRAMAPGFETVPPAQDFSGDSYQPTDEELAAAYALEHAAETSETTKPKNHVTAKIENRSTPELSPESPPPATSRPENAKTARSGENPTTTAVVPPVPAALPAGSTVSADDTPSAPPDPPGIPFSAEQTVTVGSVQTPVIVIGDQIWQKSDRKFTVKLQGLPTAEGLTALSPDGRLFAAATKATHQTDSDVHVWDTESGKRVFTVEGQPDRYVDGLLLASRRLLLGSRWNDRLLVLNTENGNRQQDVRLAGVTIQNGNTAISPDGEFVAIVSNDRLGIIRASNGRIIGAMRSPRRRPGNPRASNSGQDPGNADVYKALVALQFSPGGRFLAAVSTEPVPRILCWNSSGELEVDQALTGIESNQLNLEWLSDSSGWLIGNRIVDRESTRILAVATPAPDGFVHLYDSDHVFGLLRDRPDRLVISRIPFEELKQTARSMQSVRPALSPMRPAGLQVRLPGRVEQAEDIERLLRRELTRNDVRIEADLTETRFLLHRPDPAGPLVLELVADTRPVWSTRFRIPETLPNDDFLQELTRQLEQSTLPWLVSDDGAVVLPHIIQ